MNNTSLTLALVLSSLVGFAQTIDSSQVGKIIYYEGVVEIGYGTRWSKAKINGVVKKHQSIRTIGDALAEVTWNNGVKSFVGPNSTVPIKSLLDGSAGKVKSQNESSFSNFKSIFNVSDAKKRSEEGGIRREEVKKRKPAKDEVYWKRDKEAVFSDAYALYEKGDYIRAIVELEIFLNQKPEDEMARYALFALGHSYIMANNTVKAKEIFNRFLVEFPGDQLRPEAEKVLANL
jgi:TolA-binding protein